MNNDLWINKSPERNSFKEPMKKITPAFPNFGLDTSKKEANKVNPDLVKPPFVISIVGPRGSGKSFLTKHMLLSKDFYKGVFDYIIFMSPTLELNDDFAEFKVNDKIYKISNTREFNGTILEVMGTQTDLIKTYGKKRTPQVLFVCDDVVDSGLLRRSEKGLTTTLAMRGRHMNISLLFCVQKLSSVPRGIRLNSDMVILFSPFNFSETEQYVQEYVSKSQRKQIQQKLIEIFDVAHQFLTINNQNRRISEKLKIMFSTSIEL